MLTLSLREGKGAEEGKHADHKKQRSRNVTSLPESMVSLSFLPSGEPEATMALSMSPVARWQTQYFSASRGACKQKHQNILDLLSKWSPDSVSGIVLKTSLIPELSNILGWEVKQNSVMTQENPVSVYNIWEWDSTMTSMITDSFNIISHIMHNHQLAHYWKMSVSHWFYQRFRYILADRTDPRDVFYRFRGKLIFICSACSTNNWIIPITQVSHFVRGILSGHFLTANSFSHWCGFRRKHHTQSEYILLLLLYLT